MTRPEGYFAFNILPDTDIPDVSAATDVTLRAEFQLAGRAPLVAEQTVAGSALAVTDSPRTVAGQNVTVRIVTGAPFDLSVDTDPAPVALQGIVLRAHDPAQPVSGAIVAAGPVNTVTDAQGRFFLSALPLAATVDLAVTDNANVTNHPFRIDYDRPVNNAVLSLPD
jgi:hypothetical protein